MRAQRDKLGVMTRKKVDLLRQEGLDNYAVWIEQAKSRGEFRMDIPTDIVALYFDAQNGGAMRMQTEGVSNDVIAKVMRLALMAIQ
jgi:hypothetical protein